MDITVSSNFERLLFDLYDRDGAAIADLMRRFDDGDISFSSSAMQRARALFSSQRVSDAETCEQIAATWGQCEYLLDPHSAIGVRAALESGLSPEVPVVTLATAHPSKFPEAIRAAGLDQDVALPLHLRDLFDREERVEVLGNELAAVQGFMASNINA
jgi:threonine synthase